VNVSAWKSEKIIYGRSVTVKHDGKKNINNAMDELLCEYALAIGLEDHQKNASKKY
jgi:hypothetical protein